MHDSIFTKIIKGEIPCHKVYEDERVIAFLDIHPECEGHTLVVPKKQVDKLYELSEDDYSYLWLVAKKLAQHYDAILKKRIFFKVIGIDVPHAHIHLLPYDPVNHHSASDEPDHAALECIAEKLRISQLLF